MTFPIATLLHPVVSQALADAEQKAKLGILETLPGHRTMALRPEENTSGPLVVITSTSPILLEQNGLQPPPSPPMSPASETHTPTPAALTPDAEFRIIEAELANCQLTREALQRRESALQERKAEIVRETKMRLDKEVRDLTAQDQEGIDQGLFMRDVQRRVETKLKGAGTEGEAASEKVDQANDVEEKKTVPISAPERRRLARLALLKQDPRLGR
ncbi:uncharacterized protein J4E78_000194 [Alternaria triticimaculans]|uniref:uncharacterized protein n=1 Tax=Alternaria triticimaculans TaxID=297637 RepID=UPI0020C3607C|nr:uncharacterized protein J4E78_000194 [Alternaria triticimaculans]KAI4628215.1 hypothetical protein J4E80_002353 [Alternaria sp. BMP 0032]KAI4671698.1 hypothetical protein J4E78_000194 [Alternaria triticimaculans]